MAVYDEIKRVELLLDVGIIRNKLKVNAFIENAKAYLKMEALGLKEKGFRFVWPTICYAFMSATDLVNNHTIDCFRRTEVPSVGF